MTITAPMIKWMTVFISMAIVICDSKLFNRLIRYKSRVYRKFRRNYGPLSKRKFIVSHYMVISKLVIWCVVKVAFILILSRTLHLLLY